MTVEESQDHPNNLCGVNVRVKVALEEKFTDGIALLEEIFNERIVEMEVPVHISNVSLCTKEGEALRVKVKLRADGSRDLVYKQAGKEVVYRSVKKPA